LFIGYGVAASVSLVAFRVLLTLAVLPLPASAWNIPANMLSAAIAYQVLQQENPLTIERVKAVLEKHPWYANRWQGGFEMFPFWSVT
jgi:asparagine N-glycosylation enzyme membrane subunit Stt3